jgi:glycosyltransferase involved in cell wall biosynthesis
MDAPSLDNKKPIEASSVELSIVMPCLNEAETLATCIRKARRFLERSGISGEILIGDNGSTDGSQDIALGCGARVVDVKFRGYGAALYHASLTARGRYIIMADSDDSYDFENLEPFVEKLRDGYDLVVGNRFAGGIAEGAMPWKNRYIGNPVLSTIGRVFFRCPVRDFHCGLRGYSAEAFRRWDLRTTGMEFASEMVIKATLMRMRIVEVPTTLSPDGRSRPPHLRPWRDGWRHLRFMLLFSPRWLFLVPGAVLMLAGFLVGALLMRGPMRVGGVVFDVDTLLYAALATLSGFEAICFGVFTKIFAIGEGLLPEDPSLTRFFRYINLEVGLAIGAAVLLMGVGGTLGSLWWWRQHGFGPVEAGQMLRLVIPSALGVTLGFQIILSSLFLSVLGLRTRSYGGK